MNILDLRGRIMSKLGNSFYIITFITLVVMSYKYEYLHSLLIMSIRSAMSILILALILEKNDQNLKYITFIGVAYAISSIYEVLSVLMIEDAFKLNQSYIIINIIETLTFLFSINYLYEENLTQNEIIKKFIHQVIFLSILLIGFKVNTIKVLNIYINMSSLVLIINIIILLFILKKCRNYIENRDSEKEKLLLIIKILCLKIVYFSYLILKSKFSYINIRGDVVTDIISAVQMYLVYNLIIKTSLIHPYIKIIEANKKINRQSSLHKNANGILKRINKVQYDINQTLIYKEEFLNSILMSTTNGLIKFDKNLNAIYFNNAFRNIINYENNIDYSINKNILNCYEFIESVSMVCARKRILENEIITTNDQVYRCTYSPDNTNGGCICLVVNISNEREMLNDLVELKQEYEDLITNIKTPVFIADESYNIIKYSGSCKSFLDRLKLNKIYDDNLSEADYIGQVIHPEDKEQYKNIIDINRKACCNEELYDGGLSKHRIINCDGDVRWIESKTTLYHEGDKKFTIVSYVDMTEYINTQNILKKTNDIYKELLNNVPEGIYLEDLETNKYIYINKKFKDIFGIKGKLDELELGMCRKDLMKVHPDYKKLIKEGVLKVKQNKVSDYEYVKYLDIHNKVIEAKVASIPFGLNNKTQKLTIIKSLEEIKKLESLKKKIMERKKHDLIKMQFFINMSHELKTPLNLIFTSTQLLGRLNEKNKILNGKGYVKKHVDLTMQNSYRLLKIINDLIDFTKMESGFYKIRKKNRDIVSIIENIVISVVSYASSKEIDVIFDTDIEELVMAVDENAIERILLNILSNSIKFTKPGGAINTNIIYKKDTIEVIIEDTGIGIPEDKINFIFDRFNDVNKGYIGNIYGSGIGLSMVKSMINLIGGEISVESKLNKGTKFIITIPIEIIDNADDNSLEKYNESLNVERLKADMTDIYKYV